MLLEILSFQLKYESLGSLRIRLSRRLKMTRPDLCGRYLAVCSEDATLPHKLEVPRRRLGSLRLSLLTAHCVQSPRDRPTASS